ncbi:hypothetical protein [Dysgonomonas sp. 25]|uniref:hypothetical protein n=1 Tax=Dysgonomonas sp. 25 TaxID=2302933 RepID=UPI0013D5061D|nr:hypothetical protein [Dysgonomonas sp. 25]NDV69293.1 hypothetical protein [Dysgonomonas sp. 25]
MKTSFYSQVIQTIIAVALVVIIIQNALPNAVTPAHAQAPIPAPAQQIQSGVVDVNLVQVNGVELYGRTVKFADGEVNSYIPMSVEYVDPKTSTFNVNIKEVDGNYIHNINGSLSVYTK